MNRATARQDMVAAEIKPEVEGSGGVEGRGRYLVKLVRDRIDRLEEPPEAFGFDKLDSRTHIKCLRQKLIEEVGEYLIDPSKAELGDVYEAVRCLAAIDLELHDDPDRAMEVIRAAADEKRRERGGFEGGMGMYAEWVVVA